MPRLSDRLLSTERAVQTAKPKGKSTSEYRIAGVRGLILKVTDRGTKSWSVLFKSPVTSTWRKASLGSWPTVSLLQAKELALDFLANVRAGKDPLVRDAPEMTFRKISEDYSAAHKGRHSESWTKEVQHVLNKDVLPSLNGHRADAVKRRDVADIVERIASRGAPASANAALKVMRVVYRWGIASGRCETDPTVGIRRYPSKARERVLSDDEIRVVWNLDTGFRDAYRLQLALGMRIGEIVKAHKTEVDLEQGVWTIPSARTKSRREHRLPLSPLAIDILRGVLERAAGSGWLFPSPLDGKAMRTRSAATILQRLLGASFTSHDLRRNCASRLGDMSVSDEIIGRVLNHMPTSLTGKVYNHANRSQEVRAALDAWAEQLGNMVGER